LALNAAVLEVRMRLRSSHSLKEKRRVVRSIKDRVRARFNVSVSEVDDQDLWQSIVLGFAAVGPDHGHVHGELEKILQQIRIHPEAELLDWHIEEI
jgi:uncharacterized protein YlxP (DUF503 family)